MLRFYKYLYYRIYIGKKATPQNNAGVPAEQMLARLLRAFAAPAQAAAATHARAHKPPG